MQPAYLDVPLRKRFFPYYVGVKKLGGLSVLDRDYPGDCNQEYSELIYIDSEGSESVFYLVRPELRPAFDFARRWVMA